MSFLFKKCIPVAILLLILIPQSAVSRPLQVAVSILPQEYFIRQIAGDLVKVMVMVKPGESPATYEPRPQQMVALSKTSAYFSIGVPFENAWLDNIMAANHKMQLIRTDQGIKKRMMASHHHHFDEEDLHDGDTRHHGHHDMEATGIPDPHIWLSPPLVIRQVETMTRALQSIDRDHAGIYAENARHFIERIRRLDESLKSLFSNLKGMPFLVFHPSWGYFADAYNLKQIPIEYEGKEPKPSKLKKTIALAKAEGIRTILVQPQFSMTSAQFITREISGSIMLADPLNRDWETNLKTIAERIHIDLTKQKELPKTGNGE